MQGIVNTTEFATNSNQYNGEDTFVIMIEMVDGSSQLVHLSRDQAISLGLQSQVGETAKPVIKQPLLNYNIVQPAELNLTPAVNAEPVPKPANAPKGRPRKRPLKATNNVPEESAPKVPVKTCRTRSGRITRPPNHMTKDFHKIITEVKSDLAMTKELDTVEFEPIKTANTIISTEQEVPKEKLISLDTNAKKRFIPAQYRCTTCKKAYLGRNKMTRHFQQFPDHATANQMTMTDCEAWCVLVDTAVKANKGQRGVKFCKELLSVIRNARILVKYFFKPTTLVKSEYEVDSLLASVLDIKEGNYRFSDTELCKDVSIFSYILDENNFRSQENCATDNHFDDPLSTCNDKFQFEEMNIEENHTKDKPLIDLHFESDITDVLNLPKADKKTDALFNFETASKTSLHLDNKINEELNKNDFMTIFNEDFIDKRDVSNFGSATDSIDHEMKTPTKDKNFDLFGTNLFLETKDSDKKLFDVSNTERNGKEVDIFRNTINNILNFGASDEHMSSLLDKGKPKNRKSDEFDKFHLDELILPDAPVNHILDTSTGSDDIMNVDQFVNERFKKLTEPENELQNTSLNLDLPPLECFSFNN